MCLVACSSPEYDFSSTVCGTVLDETTLNPVDGAAVYLSPSGKSKITGTDGYFEFPDLEAKQYTITVQKSDYTSNRKTINAIAGETTEVSITIKQN